jgi:hypothetical protein
MNCQVCKAAGRSEKECSSHWVKDQNGVVICPTLLSQECRYCGNKGHTTKYCAVLKNDEHERAKETKPVVVSKHKLAAATATIIVKLNKNKFNSLCLSDSDDDDTQTAKPVEATRSVFTKAKAAKANDEPLLLVSSKKTQVLLSFDTGSFPSLPAMPEITVTKKQSAGAANIRAITVSYAVTALSPAAAAAPEKRNLSSNIFENISTKPNKQLKHDKAMAFAKKCHNKVDGLGWADYESDSESDSE